MASVWVLALLAVVSVAVAVTHGQGKSPPSGSKRPPNSRYGLPIVGHALQVPPMHSWLKFKT
ncbi:hypothetical protein BJX68DRAFT_250495 [Aspergillus pseudodeflectus]|uniref:Uncharacterized protein n=1 Tax=Aspergillus pseudodeflectus TaxID=176178 RepID=A0ABR4J9Y1_9EURO